MDITFWDWVMLCAGSGVLSVLVASYLSESK